MTVRLSTPVSGPPGLSLYQRRQGRRWRVFSKRWFRPGLGRIRRAPDAAAAALLLLAFFPGGLLAREGSSAGAFVTGLPLSSSQQVLEEEALRFSRAWVEGDVRGMESMLATEGIRLHLEGGFYPSVDPRRAANTLRAFLEKYRTGEVEVLRVSQAAGTAPRGYADLRWMTQVAGTEESVIFTLFVAFTMEETGWTVTEIRVLS